MIESGIYKVTNLVTDKVYIGSAVHLQKRKCIHFSTLRNNKHDNSHLQRAYNKYGMDSFKWEILCICDTEFLISNEQESINSYSKILGWKNLYNIRIIANSNLGIKLGPHSEETRRKMSLALKGRTFSEEHRRKISLAHSKPVEAICVKTGLVTEFIGMNEAARQWPVDRSAISKCCQGKLKTHFQHYWRYL